MDPQEIKKIIGQDWYKLLDSTANWDAFFKAFVKYQQEAKKRTLFPKRDDLFNAFKQCPVDSLRVVILGQDPYHGQGQANGLCFSVNDEIALPPSLKNIFKEMLDDIGGKEPFSGDLSFWARQGVLMLNSCLSVEEGKPASHKDWGWQEFTDSVLESISKEKTSIVFILWGGFAKKKKSLIDSDKHFVIESAHPSPLSSYRGFFGSKPFSKTNQYLEKLGYRSLEWNERR